jgi:hypothetical protein
MAGNWDPNNFPRLTDAVYAITSCETTQYNCIAWAATDILRWWEPVQGTHYGRPIFWPNKRLLDYSVAAYAAAFATIGYVDSGNGHLEAGWEKVALFAEETKPGVFEVTHAARQLAGGTWTSKLGNGEDIAHLSVTDLCGPAYGSVVRFLKRRRIQPMCDRDGPGCLNRFSASISGASAGVKLPCGRAAG